MQFWFSAELDAEVDEQYRPIRQEVERALNDHLRGRDYGPSLTQITVIPMILSAKFAGSRTERRLVKRRDRSADYRLFIDYESWARGSAQERMRLLLTNVLECVADIDRKLKGSFDGRRLIADIQRLFPDVGDDG